MPRRATKPFDARVLVARRVLEAINQVLIEPGDEPVTELELLQAYYAVELPYRRNRFEQKVLAAPGAKERVEKMKSELKELIERNG